MLNVDRMLVTHSEMNIKIFINRRFLADGFASPKSDVITQLSHNRLNIGIYCKKTLSNCIFLGVGKFDLTSNYCKFKYLTKMTQNHRIKFRETKLAPSTPGYSLYSLEIKKCTTDHQSTTSFESLFCYINQLIACRWNKSCSFEHEKSR